MTRIVKEYDERYTEFLVTAQKLFFTKGYEASSVQEIINTMNVSKGAFYHYFDSKAELLEALVVRLSEQMLPPLEEIISDESISIIKKLERFFAQIENWKIENKALMLATVRVLYMDENVLLRTKMQDRSQHTIAPLMAEIIDQGIANKILAVDYPLATAQMIIKMSEIITQSAIAILLTDEIDEDAVEHVRHQIIVYNQSVERILGLEKDTLTIVDLNVLNAWLD